MSRVIICHADDRTEAALIAAARSTGRTVEDLAEAAISEAALGWAYTVEGRAALASQGDDA